MKTKKELICRLQKNKSSIDFETHCNSRHNELLTLGSSLFSTSLTNFLAKSPSSFTKQSQLTNDDLSCPLIKNSSMQNLHQLRLNDKRRHKERTKINLDNFHKNSLRESFKGHYKSTFMTKAIDVNSPIMSLHKRPSLRDLSSTIDIPKVGMLKQHLYPVETSTDFAKKCIKLSQISYLSVIQKNSLNRYIKEDKKKIDTVSNKMEEIKSKQNILILDYKDNYLSYINFLKRKKYEEMEILRKLGMEKNTMSMEIEYLSKKINNLHNTMITLSNMRLFLICAKELINKDNKNLIQRQKLFNSSDELSSNTVYSFNNALNRMNNHKEVRGFFLDKYKHNFLVFDSAEDFLYTIKSYETKLLINLQQYEKLATINNNLKEELKKYCDYNNDWFVIESTSSRVKENKLQQAQNLYYKLIKKKANLRNIKKNRRNHEGFKIPPSVSCLTSQQSDLIINAFKYQSITKDYPIPFTCLYSKLCEIINTLLINYPQYLLIDSTIPKANFNLYDLQDLINKKYDDSTEDKIFVDIITLLKIIEKSFLEILHTFKKLSYDKTTHFQVIKHKEDIDNQKKIKGIEAQRSTVETIRKLILDNVAKKASKLTFKQFRKIDRTNHQQYNQALLKNSRSDYNKQKTGSDIQDYLYDC